MAHGDRQEAERAIAGLLRYLDANPQQRLAQALINLTRNGQGATQTEHLWNMDDRTLALYTNWTPPRAGLMTPRFVPTIAELDALGGNSVLYSEAAWAVLRKQYHGTEWVTDHTSHSKHTLTAAEVLAWAQDWQLLRVGGTE